MSLGVESGKGDNDIDPSPPQYPSCSFGGKYTILLAQHLASGGGGGRVETEQDEGSWRTSPGEPPPCKASSEGSNLLCDGNSCPGGLPCPPFL